MSCGVILTNCQDTLIEECEFNDLKVGIRAIDSDFVVCDSSFNRVGTAIEGSGQISIDASNLTHSESSQAIPIKESHWGGDATELEIIKRFANANV